jgi:hypothetical protein
LSTAILVIEPKFRYSAKLCLDRALELSVLSRGCSLTPTPASYTEGYKVSVSPDRHLAADPNWYSSQYKDSIPLSVIRRYIRSNTLSPDFYIFEESEPVIDLFGEGWLQDPNYVRSSVAAIGEDLSDWSSWGKRATEPLERYILQNILEPADKQNNNYDSYLIQGRDAFAQDYLVDTVAQGRGNCTWTDSKE